VNETLLGKFKGGFKGVTWDQHNCGELADGCLVTVCGNTHAVFRNSIVRDVKGIPPDGVTICVLGKSRVTIFNTRVRFNAATGIGVADSNVTIAGNTSITHNNASGAGGGVFVGGTSTVSITGNASITHNNASGAGGGGVYVGGNSTVNITGNASITHNRADKDGGGVSVGDTSTMSIAGTASITHNSAAGKAGGVLVGSKSTVSITGHASITNNSAVRDGGGVWVDMVSTVNITGHASITHNNASSAGGGVYVDQQSTVRIAGTASITHNIAGIVGGGVWVGSTSTVNITGHASIAHNSAFWDGGGVYVQYVSNVNITGTASITHNSASGAGGGVYVGFQSTVSITGNASITHNNASGEGGGVSVGHTSTVNIAGSASITHNNASGGDGGGVSVGSESTVSIAANASITHNNASGGRGGGGVCVRADSTLTIAGQVSIAHNSAFGDGGGVLVASNTNVSIAGNMSITHNRAGADGGGAFVDYGSRTSIGGKVSITHNRAGRQGGCLSFGRNNNVLRVTGFLLYCEAQMHGGGISLGHSSTARVQATFGHNTAYGLGGDVYALASVTMVFVDSSITHRSPSVYWQRPTCEVGEVKAPQRYCEMCPGNMYSLNPANTSCDLCPPYANCTGGSVLLPLLGHWHSHTNSTQMHKCQKPSACLVSGTCAEGYSGNLCANCTSQYGKVGAFTCGRCRPLPITLTVYFLAWEALVLFVALLVYTSMQDNLQQTRCIRPSDAAKVLTRHVQYLLLLCSVGLPWPTGLLHLRSAIAWVFGGATVQVLSVDCVLQHARSSVPLAVQNVVVRLATPATVLVAVLLLRLVIRSVRSRSCCGCSKAELIVAGLVVLFYFYPLLVQTGLNMFACIPIDNAQLTRDPYPEYAVANASRGYWVWDVQQACWQGWHLSWGLGLGLPCVMCFCILVPVGMFWILHHNRACLQAGSKQGHVGFLYHSFTPDRYYWEVVASMQTIILVVVSAFSFTLGAYHAALLMLVWFAGILAMQHSFQPYAFQQVQRMQVSSSICLMLTATIGLSTFDAGAVAVPEAYKVTIGVLGLLVNLGFVCWCAWMTVTVDTTWITWVKPAGTWFVNKWMRCIGVRSTT
jgi:hypothetical protein